MFQFPKDDVRINGPANGCKSLVFSPRGGFGSSDRPLFLTLNLYYYATKKRRMLMPGLRAK